MVTRAPASSAVAVGALSVWLIKKFKLRTLGGEAVVLHNKSFDKGQIYGSIVFESCATARLDAERD